MFLFTKDGRPKSGFMIYTFSLSLVFLALYIISFLGVLELLAPWLGEKTGILVNLIPSVIVLFIGLLVSVLLHHLLKDKRLMLGTYGWLVLYLITVTVTMAIYLHDAEAYGLFLGAFFLDCHSAGYSGADLPLVPVQTGLPSAGPDGTGAGLEKIYPAPVMPAQTPCGALSAGSTAPAELNTHTGGGISRIKQYITVILRGIRVRRKR